MNVENILKAYIDSVICREGTPLVTFLSDIAIEIDLSDEERHYLLRLCDERYERIKMRCPND